MPTPKKLIINLGSWDDANKRIVIPASAVNLTQHPFNVEDLDIVAAQLRATGKATLVLRRPGPLAGEALGLAAHELAHLTNMNVHFVRNLADRVEITARPWKR